MKDLLRAPRVAHLRNLALGARGFKVDDCRQLLDVLGQLQPLEVAELCDAWREMRGIVRRRDVIDVKAEMVR